jgi:hypothetical protein
VIKIRAGELGSVAISGGQILKSGEVSEKVSDMESWYGPRSFEGAPDWLREVVAEAIDGVTSWTR